MFKRGFSLVELSIVLVILGLLVGGVLTGQSLIRAAELRSISTEVSKYKTAVLSFRDKYLQLPGDMTNATAFWGEAGGGGTGSACRDAETNDKRTCNGDGNGLIDPNPGWEYARLWQHLSNAELIEGAFIGTASATTCNTSSPGCLYPGSKSGNNALWILRTVPSTSYSYSFYDGKNALILSNRITSVSLGYVLKPEDAFNVDTKMDDGRPGLGSIMASRTGTCDTSPTNSNSDALRVTANYRLTNTGTGCVLHFMDVIP
jgi:prepilin-type N-terminal cleavage/methylation domain-containing protein